MAKAKKVNQKGQGRAKAPECPACVAHWQNRKRFYDKPAKVGKLKADRSCSVCGYRSPKE